MTENELVTNWLMDRPSQNTTGSPRQMSDIPSSQRTTGIPRFMADTAGETIMISIIRRNQKAQNNDANMSKREVTSAKIRELRTKFLEVYFTPSENNTVRRAQICQILINTDAEMNEKYKELNLQWLLDINKDKPKIEYLVQALAILEKYASNLIKPVRPPYWRMVKFTSPLVKTYLENVQGSFHILQQMGYTKEIMGGLSFPDEILEPDIMRLRELAADLYLARNEVEELIFNRHPHLCLKEEQVDNTRSEIGETRRSGTDGGTSHEVQDSPMKTVLKTGDDSGPDSESDYEDALEEAPPFHNPSSVPKALCYICGENNVEFDCQDCDNGHNTFCKTCDSRFHNHVNRAHHVRRQFDRKALFGKDAAKKKSSPPSISVATSQTATLHHPVPSPAFPPRNDPSLKSKRPIPTPRKNVPRPTPGPESPTKTAKLLSILERQKPTQAQERASIEQATSTTDTEGMKRRVLLPPSFDGQIGKEEDERLYESLKWVNYQPPKKKVEDANVPPALPPKPRPKQGSSSSSNMDSILSCPKCFVLIAGNSDRCQVCQTPLQQATQFTKTNPSAAHVGFPVPVAQKPQHSVQPGPGLSYLQYAAAKSGTSDQEFLKKAIPRFPESAAFPRQYPGAADNVPEDLSKQYTFPGPEKEIPGNHGFKFAGKPQQMSPAKKESSKAAESQWACEFCTLLNPESNNICDMCYKTRTENAEIVRSVEPDLSPVYKENPCQSPAPTQTHYASYQPSLITKLQQEEEERISGARRDTGRTSRDPVQNMGTSFAYSTGPQAMPYQGSPPMTMEPPAYSQVMKSRELYPKVTSHLPMDLPPAPNTSQTLPLASQAAPLATQVTPLSAEQLPPAPPMQQYVSTSLPQPPVMATSVYTQAGVTPQHLSSQLPPPPADPIYVLGTASPQYSGWRGVDEDMWREKEEMRISGKRYVDLLKKAEASNFLPEELNIAISLSHGHPSGPIEWLKSTWLDFIHTVMVKVTEKAVEHDIGNISPEEARQALIEYTGDIPRAVTHCVTEREKKLKEVMESGFYVRTDCIRALDTRDGNVELAIRDLEIMTFEPMRQRILDTCTPEGGEEGATPAPPVRQLSQQQAIFESIVSDKQLNMERRIRVMFAERAMRSWGRAMTAIRLIDMNFSVEDSIQAAEASGHLELALKFLQRECVLCTEIKAETHMVTMLYCQCQFCSDCVAQYITITIQERNIMHLVCPACSEPKNLDDDNVATAYFNNLDILIRPLVNQETHDLFQRKLRDRTLMKEPNFRWCSHCSSGFINERPGIIKMACPHCRRYTCFKCKKQWEDQHEGITCEQFAAWKEANDPEAQATGLAAHLKHNGIECPNCKFRYDLAKGGCMHFKCGQCSHEYCSGCYGPYRHGEHCRVSASCAGSGLHAHHPRDCLFYLRDRDPEELKKLLDDHNVEYNTEPPQGLNRGEGHVNAGLDSEDEEEGAAAGPGPGPCQVMEQAEAGARDKECGRPTPAGYAGLCRIHFTEYLVERINSNLIDPVGILSTRDLELVLRREEKEVPPKQRGETDEQFHKRLIQFVKTELPLPRKPPRKRILDIEEELQAQRMPENPPLAEGPPARVRPQGFVLLDDEDDED